MFTIRPVFRHFVLWLVLAPIILLEIKALARVFDLLALQQSQGARHTIAEVIDYREGPTMVEIRYRFQIPGDPNAYTATDVIGRTDLWIPISQRIGQAVQAQRQIQVTYLPHNPWINIPEGRLGRILEDSAAIWVMFLIFDLVWFTETFILLRNFKRCIVAAERRQPVRMRFWRTQTA